MKIVIAGNYGAGNLGDEMILAGMLEMLRNVAPRAQITVLSGNPRQTEKDHNVNSSPMVASGFRSIFKEIINGSPGKQAIKKCDHFILGGGGLFGSLNFRSHWIWAKQAITALKYQKTLIIYGQSIGKNSSTLKDFIIRWLFPKASFIAVRDRFSQNKLVEMLSGKEVRLMPDLIFRIKKPDHRIERQKEAIVALRQMKKLPANLVPEIAKFLDWLKYPVKVIDFSQKEDPDTIIHQKLAQLTDLTEPGKLSDFPKANIAITMRLHATLTAIKTATPFIAISYAPKVRNYLKSIGLDQYCLDLDQITFENLQAKYQEIQKSRNQIIEQLMEYNKKALAQHKEIEEYLRKILL